MRNDEKYNVAGYDFESYIDEAAKAIALGTDREILHKMCPTAEAFEGWIKRVKEIYYSEPLFRDSTDDEMIILPTWTGDVHTIPASELTEEDFKEYKNNQIGVREEKGGERK